MKTLFIDPIGGAAGDMFLAALIDAGGDFDALRDFISSLPIGGLSLEIEKTSRNHISASRLTVQLKHSHDHDHHHEHRHLADILEIIDNSKLTRNAKSIAGNIFKKIAEAEAKIHDKTPETVHFHEVGAEDSIADILGSAFLIDHMKIEKIYSNPLKFGTGSFACAHGTMPIPAPATAEIAKNFPAVFTNIEAELTTPTGAAIITSLASPNRKPQNFTTESVGYGAGTRDHKELPNLLRVLVGHESTPENFDTVIELVTNLDDCSPEIIANVCENLIEHGALDAFTTPITMKKSRPATLLTILCKIEDKNRLENLIFTETTTFGIRARELSRTTLERKIAEIETPFGVIDMKLGLLGGKVVSAQPEYERAKSIAQKNNVPLKEIYNSAFRSFENSL